MLYECPARYKWTLQYYLRAHGLTLSRVGSGRLVFSLNDTDGDFKEVIVKFVAAAQQMLFDGWWWEHSALTNKSIKRGILREMIHQRFEFRASRLVTSAVARDSSDRSTRHAASTAEHGNKA